jgi:hypothetical protein
MTPLDKTLKRTLSVGGVDYVVTLTPQGLKLTRKGRRLGLELKWGDITSGESALAIALHASVGRFDTPEAAQQKRTLERRDTAIKDRASTRRRR